MSDLHKMVGSGAVSARVLKTDWTQREKLLALLEEFGITPAPNDEPEDETSVQLQAKVGGVAGWNGFVCYFNFDDEGNFVNVGVWE